MVIITITLNTTYQQSTFHTYLIKHCTMCDLYYFTELVDKLMVLSVIIVTNLL